jgi:hypothetical protein
MRYTSACTRTHVLLTTIQVPNNKTKEVLVHQEIGSPELFNGGSTTIEKLHKKATELFGADGYRAVAIIRDAEKDKEKDRDGNVPPCPKQDLSFSYGTKYREFAALPPTPTSSQSIGSVHSICSADYSPVLIEIRKFIRKVLASPRINLDVKKGETIVNVHIVRDGVRSLVRSDKYKIFAGFIEFNSGVLQPGDQILVDLKKIIGG